MPAGVEAPGADRMANGATVCTPLLESTSQSGGPGGRGQGSNRSQGASQCHQGGTSASSIWGKEPCLGET